MYRKDPITFFKALFYNSYRALDTLELFYAVSDSRLIFRSYSSEQLLVGKFYWIIVTTTCQL